MKARRKGTNEPFQKVASVCLCSGGYILIKDVEFEQPVIDHQQDLRERAAIAAMQSFLSFGNTYKYITPEGCADNALRYADALVKKLKGE